ncbi:MAG: type II secretion system F family protein [Nanoarchaeota archaeon]|nr:type II secretion system F family protein [Nanoarchaeota archaeon]
MKNIHYSNIPYSIIPVPLLRKIYGPLIGIGALLEKLFPNLSVNLERSDSKYSAKEYLAMCFCSDMIAFVLFSALFFYFFRFLGIGFSVLIVLFVFSQQLMAPLVFSEKKKRELERNLLHALQEMHIQLSSGVTLFDAMSNVANSNYGAVSKEFDRAVKKISSGMDQVLVLEEMAESSPSLFFKRTIEQLANGMRSGADANSVIKDIMHRLSEEQVIQLQSYGSQLNPLTMMYMLFVVIMPVLGTIFILLMSSMMNISEIMLKAMLWGLFLFVFVFQTIFIGLIKSRRPNLL